MKPRRTLRALAAIFGCTIALTGVMPAFARAQDDVTGDWLFDTSKFADNDCQISGRITFTPTAVKNTYTCVFESEQICGKLNGNLYIRVRQVCTAQRIGKQVAIKSKVDKILERRPDDSVSRRLLPRGQLHPADRAQQGRDERLALRRTAPAQGALLARRRADLVNTQAEMR